MKTGKVIMTHFPENSLKRFVLCTLPSNIFKKSNDAGACGSKLKASRLLPSIRGFDFLWSSLVICCSLVRPRSLWRPRHRHHFDGSVCSISVAPNSLGQDVNRMRLVHICRLNSVKKAALESYFLWYNSLTILQNPKFNSLATQKTTVPTLCPIVA